jgi:hypothetical protein
MKFKVKVATTAVRQYNNKSDTVHTHQHHDVSCHVNLRTSTRVTRLSGHQCIMSRSRKARHHPLNIHTGVCVVGSPPHTVTMTWSTGVTTQNCRESPPGLYRWAGDLFAAKPQSEDIIPPRVCSPPLLLQLYSLSLIQSNNAQLSYLLRSSFQNSLHPPLTKPFSSSSSSRRPCHPRGLPLRPLRI